MVDGRIMSGQIDLLLQTESGAIIIDYKSGHLPPDPANEKIQRYAGQLKAYSSALQGAAEVKAYLVSTGDRKSTRPELQSLMRISYAVFCLKKKNIKEYQVSTKELTDKNRT